MGAEVVAASNTRGEDGLLCLMAHDSGEEGVFNYIFQGQNEIIGVTYTESYNG